MKTENKNIELRVIIPSDGMWITQNKDIKATSRIFSKEVYLGAEDLEDNWKEVDETYKAEIEKEAITIRSNRISASK